MGVASLTLKFSYFAQHKYLKNFKYSIAPVRISFELSLKTALRNCGAPHCIRLIAASVSCLPVLRQEGLASQPGPLATFTPADALLARRQLGETLTLTFSPAFLSLRRLDFSIINDSCDWGNLALHYHCTLFWPTEKACKNDT